MTDPEVVPKMYSARGAKWLFATRAEAEDIAARTRQPVHFIAIDYVKIDEAKGMIWLGAGLAVPPGTVRLCCCEREAQFERRDGRWMFDRWTGDGRCY